MVLILKNALPSTKNTHYHHVPLSTTTEDPSDESSFDSDDPSENQILLHKRKTRSPNPNGNPSLPFFYTKLLLQTAYQRSFQKTAKNVTLQFFFPKRNSYPNNTNTIENSKTLQSPKLPPSFNIS